MKIKIQRIHRWIHKLALVLLMTGLVQVYSGWGERLSPALAQTAGEAWTLPVNLSHSGAASNPELVTSADGQVHVIWRDLFSGYFYTHNTGGQWAPPQAVTFPFSPPQTSPPGSPGRTAPADEKNPAYIPVLIADGSGSIYAFWLDDTSALFYSHVEAQNFGNSASWTPPEKLAVSVLHLDAAVDPSGGLHVTYIQSLDLPAAPAGVYALNSAGGRQAWKPPVSLYQSPYFRSLTPGSVHVKIAIDGSGDGQRVYAAWENPARERVYTARSLDGGATWEEPIEVDAPVDGSIVGGPANITINAYNGNVLLIWQTDNSGSSCTQYYEWSLDGGSSWQPRQRMLESLPGCPQTNQILVGQNGQVFLLTSITQQMYLLAWNGTQWSQPQLQPSLTSFTDPDTFKPVSFSCRQAALVGGNTLYVVGCDSGNGKDVWVTLRTINDVSAWFSQNPAWNTPLSISSGQAPVLHPSLATDQDNRIHAVWSQADGAMPGSPGNVIYYARFEAGQWSTPVAVLASPEGVSENPSITADDQGNLMVVWSGGQSGQIFFSQASASRAIIASAWSEPQALPSPKVAGSSPEIHVDGQGTIYVIFAIPLNEQRGIYLTWSTDHGATWAQPLIVFDAAGANWAMVDQPHLAFTTNGNVHLLWTRFTFPSGAGSLGMYYARSGDGGRTWTQAETVVDHPVLWSQLIGVGERTVHRFWKEFNNGRTTLWHEQSLDGGVTWKRIAPVSIFGDTVGDPTVTIDRAGRLHLLQVVSRGTSSLSTQGFTLQHWVFDGDTWTADQSEDVESQVSSDLSNLKAVVSPDGTLGVIFSGVQTDALTGQPLQVLFYTARKLDVPALAPTPLPPLTPTPFEASPTPLPAPQIVETSTPTLQAAAPAGPQNPGKTSSDTLPNSFGQNAWLGTVVGPLIAGLIVLVVFVLGVRRVGLRRR